MIGQIIFFLRILGLDRREAAEGRVAGKSHRSGVAAADRQLGRRRVLGFANGDQFAVPLDQTAVDRLERLKAEGDQGCAVGEPRAQPPQRRGADQGHVGVGNQHVVKAPRDRLARRQRRMGGAAAFVLDEDLDIGGPSLGFARDGLVAGADHQRDMVGAGALHGGQRMAKHGAAGDFVQHFWPRRFHPRALAGGEQDRQRAARAAEEDFA